MLQLENVIKTYKTKAGAVNALNGVSLTFPTTGLVFVTGKSGCGKTTLLNVIGGLDSIDGGEIFVQDKRFSTFSASEYDSYRNTFIGFIFQEYNLLPEFTVEKNIKMAMELQGRKADEEEFEKLLKDVGIEEFKDRFPSELSGGQRQRVAIARALVKQPRIIMADEPTGALDSDTGEQVLETLKKLSEKTLVIVVSHDREFAEKYGDRIIHLIDGQVAQDVTFTEKQMDANVSEQGDTLVIREGADLSEAEKDAVAKAVKERKGIEVVEKFSFRDKAPTGVITREVGEPASFKKSQMKARSAMQMGAKSLIVKPLRLILTVLISAIAFAVFGLFDTIANFTTEAVLKNQLEEVAVSETVLVKNNYIVNYDAGDYYTVKVSQNVADKLQAQTGGAVKGVFDLYENMQEGVKQSLSITELISKNVDKGINYYAKNINGFVEFDLETEILHSGRFKDFNYKVVEGKYPTLGENENPYQIAISTYLADSIRLYMKGEALNEKTIATNSDLLGAEITINYQKYTIVGLIDCGDIPEKYNPLALEGYSSQATRSLVDDFKSYIDSSAQKCLFVAEGFMQAVKTEKQTADMYQIGNTTWSMTIDGLPVTKKTANYLYNAEQYGVNNILLFDGNYPPNGKLSLADNEVLVHPNNLEDLFALEIGALKTSEEKRSVATWIQRLNDGDREGNRNALNEIFKILGVDGKDIDAKISQRFNKTNTTAEQQIKIVGVYFGIKSSGTSASKTYKLMMNKALMESLGVCSEQGEYTKLLFSETCVEKGSDVIVEYLLKQEGLSFEWYNNSALNMILDNEVMLRDFANLFLYAAIVLSMFSIFMIYNYIAVSISTKKQSVGVLRGLGASGKNILCIFLVESVIVALLNGLLANILTVLGCSFVNAYIVNIMNISVHFALFGGRQVLLIMAISLLTAILSATLPILKISKKKPIELIRRP